MAKQLNLAVSGARHPQTWTDALQPQDLRHLLAASEMSEAV